MPQNWKTVRIFISSTFRDMHTERDHLVRVVFPELKERCRKHRVHLIDVDLRWGVSESDAQDGKALDICLDEIDSCRPYFLGLLGHRYGWTPPGHDHSITAQEIYHGVLHNEIPRQVVDLQYIIEGRLEGKKLSREQRRTLANCYLWNAERNKWILEHDPTDKEKRTIQSIFAEYSAYQRDRSFFFFRSESLTNQMAGSNRDDFFEKDKSTQNRLAALKEEIKAKGLSCFEYDHIEPTDESDSEAFFRKVRDVLWDRIVTEIEEEEAGAKKDWLDEETALHELFMTELARKFVGRRPQLDRLHEFCEMDPNQFEAETPQYQAAGFSDPIGHLYSLLKYKLAVTLQSYRSSVMIVTGEPGSGKSALLAQLFRELSEQRPDCVIIPHIVGVSPSSTNPREMLYRLCHHIYRSYQFEEAKQQQLEKLRASIEGPTESNRRVRRRRKRKEDDQEKDREKAREIQEQIEREYSIPEDYNRLKETFDAFLRKIEGLSELIIIFDGVHNFEKTDDAHALDWLPQELPENIKCIISTAPDGTLESLLSRKFTPALETLTGLDEAEAQQLVLDYLEEIRHEFPNPQVQESFFEKVRTGNPLYITVALEELRVFGQFERLAERVNELPEGVSNLFEQVLDRIESDIGSSLVRHCLSYIACGKHGMTVEELQALLGEHTPNRLSDSNVEKLPDMLWARLYRAFGAYLVTRSGVIDFSSLQFKAAVEQRYLGTKSDRISAHEHLASYFEGRWQEPYVRALDELPYQLLNAQDWISLERTLTDLKFIEKKCAAGLTHHLIEDYQRTIAALPESEKHIHEEEEHAKRLGKYVTDLLAFAKRQTDHLDVIPTVGLWGEKEEQEYVQKVTKNPTRLEKFRQFSHFVTAESHSLAKFGTMQGFCVQQAYNSADSGLVVESAESIVRNDNQTVYLLYKHRPPYRSHPLLMKTLEGHIGWVNAVNMHPNGKLAVSGGEDKTIRVWDLETGRCVRTIREHTGAIRFVDITADECLIISASAGGAVRVWDAKTGLCMRSFERAVERMRITPDGGQALFGCKKEIGVFDLKTGVCKKLIPSENACISISPDGKYAVTESGSGVISLWDLKMHPSQALMKWIPTQSGRVECIAMTPDCTLAISAGWGKIAAWDLRTDTCVRILEENVDVKDVRVTPDGKRAISSDADGYIRVWNIQNGACDKILRGHLGAVICVDMTPDGRYAISGGVDGTVRLWDLERGLLQDNIENRPGPATAVNLTYDGTKAISFSWPGKTYDNQYLHLWDVENGTQFQRLMGHWEWVNSIHYMPDSKHVISADTDYNLLIWDVEKGTPIKTIEDTRIDDIVGVRMLSDGKRFITPDQYGNLLVLSLETGTCLRTMEDDSGHIARLSVTPNDLYAISAGNDDSYQVKRVCVWDLNVGELIGTLQNITTEVSSVCLSSDGKRAACGFKDSTIGLWNVEKGTPVTKLEGHRDEVTNLIMLSGGDRLISAGYDCTIRVWNLASRSCTMTLEDHEDCVSYLSLTPDEKRLLSSSHDKTIRVWNLGSGLCEKVLEGAADGISRMTLSPDGAQVLGADSSSFYIWDIQSGELLKTIVFRMEPVEHISFTPDNKRAIVACDDKVLRVWDVDHGTCMARLEGHTDTISRVAITPDGRRAVSASTDKTLRVWDIETGDCLQILEGHTSSVTCVDAMPDGRLIISAAEDGTIRLWDLMTGEQVGVLGGYDGLLRKHKPEAAWYAGSLVRVTPDGRYALSEKGEDLIVCTMKNRPCTHSEALELGNVVDIVVSADAKRAVTQSGQRTLRVWDLSTGQLLSTYQAPSEINSISHMGASCKLAIALENGEVIFLQPHNLMTEVPVVTARRLWKYGRAKVPGRWDDEISGICMSCGCSFAVKNQVLDLISAIHRDVGLPPEKAPCLSLPAEAWEEPGLLSECPHCQEPLKFNPFIVSNRDRY